MLVLCYFTELLLSGDLKYFLRQLREQGIKLTDFQEI